LFVTPDGVPHIAYQANSMLWYAYFKGPTWWFTSVDNEPGAGYAPALAHDSRGRINLFYFCRKTNTEQVRHAFWDGETSTITQVAEARGYIGNSVIILRHDSQDYPHIAYSEYGYALFGSAYCTALVNSVEC
jgi:hypothetical protein